MPTLKTTRRPTIGLLLPKSKSFISTDIPIGDNESPVVFCRVVGDVKVGEATANGFYIENTTAKIVPYFATVVPRALVYISMIPWRDALKLVQVAYSSGVINEKIIEFFSSFKTS